ncbi:MAG TPA: hypothetical protein VK508_15240 [Cyclobacteriaceae bacterium]|nr:hypothetical protein [Cyclobacteriaceae bacterium]
MLYIDPDTFILHSIIYCILFTLSLVPIGLINPRMMLYSYPKEIQKLVPPKFLVLPGSDGSPGYKD